MKFLIRTNIFEDETLESYLLRLANANGFTKFSLFQNSLKELFSREISKRRLSGALPPSLSRVNLYKAKNSSVFRVRALKLIEQLANIEKRSLLDISILRTNLRFGASRTLSRNGVLFPKLILRDDSCTIPVCPECLKQSSCIRFDWHLKTVSYCHLHQVDLIHHCPQCDAELNYIKNELIDSCTCGFRLADASVNKNETAVAVENESESLADFGKCLWFSKHKGVALDAHDFILKLGSYFKAWPQNYLSELQGFERKAQIIQSQPFNKIAVNDIWKEQLSIAKCASPVRYKNAVINVIADYFIELVDRYPASENQHANIADSLLTLIEASLLMRTTTEQVYLLVEQGYLDIAVNIKTEQYLESHIPVFFLRQVVELMQSQGVRGHDFNRLTTVW
ncbi:TniQ family protein [Shewanella sp. 202IG2-18]|uniref:TniQ family protein n=1 Tax=Parashewanella hymeniacidonis TaxID=2807618 RepID=UPI001961C94E|nr:TniQ family protein [Parashewanella hymeniacidonis]MBM7070678.1 TniQ family protein [Parashewanella hymeniacidonis]